MKDKVVEKKIGIVNGLGKCPEAGKIAMFYGFSPVSGPVVTKADYDSVKDFEEEFHPEEKASILREFSEIKSSNVPQPLMLWMESPLKGSQNKKRPGRLECELCIVNSSKSISEIMLMQAGRAILENLGFKNTSIRLNSIGNRESVAEFERKMSLFIRKRFGDMPQEIRQKIKKDIFFLARSKEEKHKEIKELIPQSIDCLSEESRIHLKEILEYLESLEIPYEIEPSLLGDPNYSTEIIFEIVSEEGEVLASGMRWNRLAKKISHKKEVPAVSLEISAKLSKPHKMSPVKEARPKFYLIQFGPEAKQKSLLALEKLRKAGVSVSHSLAKDKLVGQMMQAESMSIPYIILIGQKEALENSVVIRNVSTRAQESVTLGELSQEIKRFK